MLPSNQDSISFLSDDKSTLLTRFFSDEHPRWKKTKLIQSADKAFYTIKTTIDLLSQDIITFNIAEGVMDIISVYKHLTPNKSNNVYLSTLGKNYESGIIYAISHGFVGDNVILDIYIDSDIDEKILIKSFKKYKWLYKRISIYKNINFEDFGTHYDKIKIIEYRL
jgi:hypothetical protein